MAIALEPEFHTRGIIVPETRFALRRWLRGLVGVLNAPNSESWNMFFADTFTCIGWSSPVASADDWQHYLQQRQMTFADYVFRYAELTVEPTGELWELRGVLEEFVGGLLITQGQVTLLIEERADGFVLLSQSFLPRLLVNPESL
jgi:hypothetical protein